MALGVGDALPKAFLDAEVHDRTGAALRLGARLEGTPAVVLMLRHYGCTGCSRQVDGLAPHFDGLASAGLRVVLVGNGSPAQLDAFIERQRVEGYPIELYADPERRTYAALAMPRSTWHVFSLGALAKEIASHAQGYGTRSIEGDLLQQGGALVVDEGGVVRFLARAPVAAEPIDPGRIVVAALACSPVDALALV